MRVLPDQGLMIDGPISPSDAMSQTTAYLQSIGWDEWDIFELDLPGRTHRAWWAGDEIGFTGPDYPGAIEVAIVNGTFPAH